MRHRCHAGTAAGAVLAPFLPALLAAPHAAQGLADPLPPANPVPIVYCPPERLAADPPDPSQALNVFLPLGTAPADGWPVVLSTGYGGGVAAPPVGALRSTGATRPLFELVEAGIAVVHYGVSGTGAGRGLWFPPGHPSGRHESFAGADDSPEKSAQWAVQWAKVQTSWPLDPDRIALRGSSGGAVLAIRTAMGPDGARAAGSPQVRASTRVAAVLALRPPTSIWALVQGPELGIPIAAHLERADAPGVAADFLAQVDPELQKDYSLMRAAFALPEVRARNARQPIALLYDDPVLTIDGEPATFELDASGFPVLHDVIAPPTQHDAWFGYRFWGSLIQVAPGAARFHAARSMFAVREDHALAKPWAIHTHTFRGTLNGSSGIALANEWVIERLREPRKARGAAGPLSWPATSGEGGGRVVPGH
jgi:hypothetical protein